MSRVELAFEVDDETLWPFISWPGQQQRMLRVAMNLRMAGVPTGATYEFMDWGCIAYVLAAVLGVDVAEPANSVEFAETIAARWEQTPGVA